MDKRFLKDALGWGFVLWLIGYALGFLFYKSVPPEMIGWVIMPIGTPIMLWVLLKKIKSGRFQRYLAIAAIWTAIAVIFDYFFIVKALNSGSYYKLDVYVYYILTFSLPLVAGSLKNAR